MMVVYTRLQRRNASAQLASGSTVARVPQTNAERITVVGTVALVCVLLFTPLVALVHSPLLMKRD